MHVPCVLELVLQGVDDLRQVYMKRLKLLEGLIPYTKKSLDVASDWCLNYFLVKLESSLSKSAEMSGSMV